MKIIAQTWPIPAFFHNEEYLQKENQWYCPKCKEHRNASKKITLSRTPEILIIHLKRFVKHIGQRYVSFQKINDYIDYPLVNWDLKSFCLDEGNEEEIVYDLMGVIHHYGKMGGGHYISVSYNFVKERWIKFDDENVSYADESDVQNRSAYVLFYKRRR